MKKLIFISLLFLLLFSCKKERLKDDFSILIGEWRQTKLIDHSTSGCSLEIFDSKNPPKITFKKNGKVYVSKFAVEEKFLMRLNKIDVYPPDQTAYFSCSQTVDSIENYYLFNTELSQRFSALKQNPSFFVNEDKLIISSNSRSIISASCEDCGTYYKHIFEKVN